MISAVKAALIAAPLLLLLAACGGAKPERRRTPPPPSPRAKAVIRTAKSYLPEEDKNRPAPKDCSDFVGKVFAENEVRLPRGSEEMSSKGDPVLNSRDLRMADLLFFSGSKGGRKVDHVAIYVNNGVFIHQANPGEGVRMESLYSDGWRRRYLKARRVLD